MGNKRKRKTRVSSGIRKDRAGKNLDRQGRPLSLNKFERRALNPSGPSDSQKNMYFEFHEKDRRDRKGRMDRLSRSEKFATANAKKNSIDKMKTPLVEVVLKDLKSAQILQTLFVSAGLKFIVKSYWPFFRVQRLHKVRGPIRLRGV